MGSDFTWFFLSFKGRMSRQEFWLGYFGLVAVLVLARLPLQNLTMSLLRPASGPWYRAELEWAIMSAQLIAVLSVLWPLLAICGKRLHDMNLSGWWLLAVPALSGLAVMTNLGGRISFVSVGFSVIGLVRGTQGDNRFGVDPLRA
jgi:uncharacterized membrane protein YhaH (DUF805 family)